MTPSGAALDPERVRPAAVAGLFYPDQPGRLRRHVDALIDDAPAYTGPAPRAIVAPHAGYIYSGPTAGHAYRALQLRRDDTRRVLLFGPAHRVPVDGVALHGAGKFATPLGPVEVEAEAWTAAADLPGVVVDDLAHAPEHSVEVHIPFLQRTLAGVPMVPMVVGRGGPPVVEAILDELWDDDTVVVVSTDLSHYLDDLTAKDRDRRTAAAIVDVRPDDIGPYDACGAAPVRGLLGAVADREMAVTLLDLKTSADTAGEPDRVVGYGAFAVA